ncbi:MAG: hypothetical protein WB609_09100 [Candidatus Cybelea sp.]
MVYLNKIAMSFIAGSLLVLTACNAHSIPSTATSMSSFSSADSSVVTNVDTTSMLKKFKKNVPIGSTVDPKNGDMGPRGASIVATGFGGLKKGQVLNCNFDDKTGAAAKGMTIEKLGPSPGKPATFATNTKMLGCADDSVSPASDDVYAAGFGSGLIVQFKPSGKVGKTWGKPMVHPISVVDAACTGGVSHCGYSAEYVYASDAAIGGIVSFSVNFYGNRKATEVISGFAVNKKSGWSALGPAGLAFDSNKKGTLYAVDGVDNTVVTFNNATELLVPSEIVVKKGGKTFTCKYPKTTCGKLIHAGAPLNAPVAMTLLPNGNLIVANSKGGNTLVELTPTGKILATKVVDTSTTAGIFGLRASGTNDSDTVLYYTDRNDNKLHELEQ